MQLQKVGREFLIEAFLHLGLKSDPHRESLQFALREIQLSPVGVAVLPACLPVEQALDGVAPRIGRVGGGQRDGQPGVWVTGGGDLARKREGDRSVLIQGKGAKGGGNEIPRTLLDQRQGGGRLCRRDVFPAQTRRR